MKKRVPRRILTAILSLAMVLSLLPATALAANSAEAGTSPITFQYYSQATLDSTNPDQVKAPANTVKFTVNLLDANGNLTTTAILDGSTIPATYTSNGPIVLISELLSQISIPGYTLENSYAFFFWSGNTSVSQGLNLTNAGAHKVTAFKNFAEVSDRYGDGSARLGTTSNTNTMHTIGYTMTELDGTAMSTDDWTNDTEGYYAYEYGGVLHIVLMPVSQKTTYKTRYINYAENDDTLVDTTDAHDMTYTSTTSGTTWSGKLTLTSLQESDLTSPGSDYVFEGWYFDCDENGNGTGTKVVGNEVMYSDNTVYARWVKKYEAQTENYVYDYAKTMTVTPSLTNSDDYLLLHDNAASAEAVASLTVTQNESDTTISGTAAASGANLTYTPTTMSPDVDKFNVTLTDTNKVTVTDTVNFIPANNVYYEDDFITTSTDGTTSTGTVGIVYTGDWTTVSGNTSTGNNTETVNGDTHGWEESLSDDDTYSDGTAHAANATSATATFTFTGTGVDIYSRTDMNTGKVKVTLKGTSEGNTTSKVYVCNNLSESGTYYQIPTVSFENLTYDTYTVTIKVATNATGSEYTYYLDGVRIYNPLGTVTEEDGDAYEAYKADDELNAVFTEVRDILIDAKSFTANYEGTGGVVFIDNNVTNDGETADPDNTTSIIGTYESYGPENEVYLATGQSIAFKVSGGDNYYLGLKSADGLGTKSIVTDGATTKELTISHSTDLYYEINPTSDSYIMVKNSGSNLLSITKLRSTSSNFTESGISLLSADEVDEIMVYVASFDSLETAVSTETGVEEDSFDDTENDIETDADTETDDVVEDLDEDDIVIDNPTEDTDNEQTEESEGSSQQSSFSSLFNNIRNWFNVRR